MTIGQRIAQKRKEEGLSQEALGAALGVSRQAIYKWESDSALPEIDKLITLSKRFGVSVGWLLGVEDSAFEDAPREHDRAELTETQLKMVEEIVGRYIAAQPAPKRRKKWPFLLAAVILLFALVRLFDQFDMLRMQNESLQNNISRVERSVDSQIGGISERVEEILKSQNDLTADYGVELIHRDLARNTVTFSLRAVPKTHVDGMTAVFLADCGSGPVESPGAAAPGQAFTGEITAELTDSISLSVVFTYPDGTRQTQLLDNYSGLYTDSMPTAEIGGGTLMWMKLEKSGTLVFGENTHERYVWIQNSASTAAAVSMDSNGEALRGPAETGRIRVGLFKNRRLAAWAESCEKPDSFRGFEDCSFYRLPTLELPLAATDTVQLAAVVEDVYGRTIIQPDMAYGPDIEGLELTHADGYFWDTNPANWEYE